MQVSEVPAGGDEQREPGWLNVGEWKEKSEINARFPDVSPLTQPFGKLRGGLGSFAHE